ncbi:MAG: TetR/AcrR family transcriptional regulator [Acidimicrobiia bacterium]
MSRTDEISVGVDTALGRPQNGKAQRTFDLLVVAARDQMAAAGAFSTEQVATRAGVAPATLYTYFSTKDDLVAAAFDRVLADLNGRITATLTIERLLDDGLAAVVSAAVASTVEGFRRDALVFRLALARLPEHRLIRDVYRAREDEGFQMLRRFVELGTAAHKIRHTDRDVLAGVLLVVLQGCNNHHLLTSPRGDEVAKSLALSLAAALAPA